MTPVGQGPQRPSRTISVGVFIASLFIGSAGLRIFDPGMTAIAQEAASYVKDRVPTSETPGRQDTQTSPAGTALASELRERQRQLDSREKEVLLRERELSMLSEQVASRIEDLETAERRLEMLVNTASKLAAADVENLTAVYSNMKPKRAGALFEKMNPDFAAGFLRGMSPEAASLILAEMSAESAYAVSVVLAGQHQDVPE